VIAAEPVDGFAHKFWKLVHLSRRANQNPQRDYAVLLVLLHTALRVSELLALDLDQYRDKHLVNIRRKDKKVTRELLLARPAREALARYIKEVRLLQADLHPCPGGGREPFPGGGGSLQ
jgi:integrase